METSMVFTYPDSLIWDWRVAFDLFFGGMGKYAPRVLQRAKGTGPKVYYIRDF